MRLTDFSIKTRLIAASGILLVLGLGAVTAIGSSIMMSATLDETEALAREMSQRNAMALASEIGNSTMVVRTTARNVTGLISEGGMDRDRLGNLMRGALSTNPAVIGMTLAFEPNALDGRDAEFTDHAYSDASGRFVPYFFRQKDGSIGVEKLVMTKEAGTEGWYDVPLAANRDLITPPYVYPIEGKDVLMTTVSAIVRRNDKPVAIATVDLPLTDLSASVTRLKPFGVGSVQLVGGGNIWVGHADEKLLGKPVEDKATLDVIANTGEKGDIITAADGTRNFVVVSKIGFPGLKEQWSLITTVPVDVMLESALKARNMMLAALVAALVLGLGVVWWIARSLTNPITSLTGKMRQLAEGDMSVTFDGVERRDEIGSMVRAVDVFRANAIERQNLEQNRSAHELQAQQRQSRIEALIEEFRQSSHRLINDAASANQQLDTVAQALASVSSSSADAAVQAGEASGRASNNVQSVASAAEELTASIGEIQEQIERTTTVVARATQGARTSNEKVAQLAEAATKIGTVVDLIQEIAEQTNLLALNATIEAARAGDLGKGFAVVASEVKTLASQTARATSEISAQIAAIQSTTAEAVEAIHEISSTVDSVSEYSGAIAAAINQQGAATNEISHSVGRAAHETQQVVGNVTHLSKTVDEANQSTQRIFTVSQTVSEATGRLEHEIETFLKAVAAA